MLYVRKNAGATAWIPSGGKLPTVLPNCYCKQFTGFSALQAGNKSFGGECSGPIIEWLYFLVGVEANGWCIQTIDLRVIYLLLMLPIRVPS